MSQENSNLPTTFEDTVKAKLKSIVADLIPEERFDAIVRAAVTDFEKNDIPKLIREELTSQFKAQITTEFCKPEWQAMWLNGQQQASEAIKNMIIEAAPMILANMISSSAQQVMYDYQNRIQQQRY